MSVQRPPWGKGTVMWCEGCGRPWANRLERWRVYLTDEEVEDEPPRAVVYCPACAEREFG